MREQPLPARVHDRQHRQQHVAEVGQRDVHFVGDKQPFAAQRPRLPQQRDLSEDRLFDQIAIGRLDASEVAQAHEPGDAIAMIDHALAHDFGRMRGQHRHNQGAIQQRGRLVSADALFGQALQRRLDIVAGMAGGALPVFGQIREHRKQHEPADEGQRLVQAQRVESAIDRRGAGDPAVAIDRRGPDRFDALEQRVAAIRANDVAEKLAEVADVCVLGDRGGHGSVHYIDRRVSVFSQFCHAPPIRSQSKRLWRLRCTLTSSGSCAPRTSRCPSS